MHKQIAWAIAIALATGTTALAQYDNSGAANSGARSSGSMRSPMSSNSMLKQHLTAGAQIYDTGGKVVASVTTVKDDGSILIRETSVAGGPTPTIDRVLPMSMVSWTNNRLVTSLSAQAIGKLPSAS